MKRIMVRYRVKAEEAAQNRRFVEAVFAELRAAAPAGLRYASFVQPDGVSFVHIASVETADGGNPLTASAAFKAFQAGIKDRCDEQPVAVELQEVGAYRMFGTD
jgi:hypothetical protein